MIARNSPIRSGWPTAGILIALAVTRLAGQTAINAPEQDAEGRVRTVNPNSESIAEAIAVLRTTDIRDSKRWAKAAFDLVQIGKPAVPALIEELDRTTENRPLRSLGFTLRAIGDPRAVPALIRAIPRTLVPAGSDFGHPRPRRITPKTRRRSFLSLARERPASSKLPTS